MRITREWIFKYRTKGGSWTRDQLAAISVDWPPVSGWIDRVIGNEIDSRAEDRFKSRKSVKQCRKELNALIAAQRAGK